MNPFEELFSSRQSQIEKIEKSIGNELETFLKAQDPDKKEKEENNMEIGEGVLNKYIQSRNEALQGENVEESLKENLNQFSLKYPKMKTKFEEYEKEKSIKKSMEDSFNHVNDGLNKGFSEGKFDEEVYARAVVKFQSIIEKAQGHKYFKREGAPGNYKYYYTEEQYKKEKGLKGDEKDMFDRWINARFEKTGVNKDLFEISRGKDIVSVKNKKSGEIQHFKELSTEMTKFENFINKEAIKLKEKESSKSEEKGTKK